MLNVKRTAVEFLVICLIGVVAGFFANGARTRGSLVMGRNYFDRGESLVEAQRAAAASARRTAEASPSDTIAEEAPPVDRPVSAPAVTDQRPAAAPGARTQAEARPTKKLDHPYQEIEFEELLALLDEPETAMGLNVLVDARVRESYADGHIPGALQCFPYETELCLDDILPYVLGAEKVIVYCGGGDCEDSIFMARELLKVDVPIEALYLYIGGWNDWKARQGPVQGGA